MTLFDVISQLPIWIQAIFVIFLAVVALQIISLPFKIGKLNKLLLESIRRQEQTLEQIKKDNADLEKTNGMLAAALGVLLRKEQSEKDKKNA